jgi:ATP-dependent RNA helicase DDX10/DBP4
MHELSAGLLIGGKNVKFEQERIKGMNILICTPGRLLQHMNESEGFDASNLKVLVFDEVDRLLDMGFKDTIDQVMRNLPKQMQVMLFSATVGQKLKELARVNLKPQYEYICIHDFDSIESRANDYGGVETAEDKALTEQLKSITPVKLLHYYMQVNIEEKLDTLFSFLKSHQSSKCIVFFSACKQVRFAYEAFKRLKAGA